MAVPEPEPAPAPAPGSTAAESSANVAAAAPVAPIGEGPLSSPLDLTLPALEEPAGHAGQGGQADPANQAGGEEISIADSSLALQSISSSSLSSSSSSSGNQDDSRDTSFVPPGKILPFRFPCLDELAGILGVPVSSLVRDSPRLRARLLPMTRPELLVQRRRSQGRPKAGEGPQANPLSSNEAIMLYVLYSSYACKVFTILEDGKPKKAAGVEKKWEEVWRMIKYRFPQMSVTLKHIRGCFNNKARFRSFWHHFYAAACVYGIG